MNKYFQAKYLNILHGYIFVHNLYLIFYGKTAITAHPAGGEERWTSLVYKRNYIYIFTFHLICDSGMSAMNDNVWNMNTSRNIIVIFNTQVLC